MSYTPCVDAASITNCIITNDDAFNNINSYEYQGSGSDDTGWNFDKNQYSNIDKINTFLEDQQTDIQNIYARLDLTSVGTMGTNFTGIDGHITSLHNNLGQYSHANVGSGADYSNNNPFLAYDISGNLKTNTSLNRFSLFICLLSLLAANRYWYLFE